MKKRILLSLTLIIFAIIVSIIVYERNNTISIIENIKNNINKQSQINENTDVTIIDITNLETGSNLNHKHILKTSYNSTQHWNECITCHEKEDIIVHNFKINSALGNELCGIENPYIKTCSCGYSETEYKPCVWNGSYMTHAGFMRYDENGTWIPDEYAAVHTKKCSVCGNQIIHSYYIGQYGNGKLYNSTLGKYGDYAEYCKRQDGKKLDCYNLGTCQKCNYSLTTQHRRMYMDLDQGKILCAGCYLELGTVTYHKDVDNNVLALNTITIKVKLNEPYTLTSFEKGGLSGPITAMYQTFSQELSEVSEDKKSFTITIKAKFGIDIKTKYIAENSLTINNSVVYIEGIYAYPEKIKPEITEINSSNNTELTEWSQNKPIVVKGTENYCDNVSIKIVEVGNENNVIFYGKADVENKQFEISCIPQLELEALEKKYKCIVTDTCENSTSQEFTISKIDIMPPTPISGTEIDGEWSKSKKFTFIATDDGVGNVSIAFNNIEDLKLANTNEDRFSRDYEFIGDLYQAKEFSVLYQDGLGNDHVQKIIIDKLDNTAPTITKATINNNIVTVEANDIKEGLGEGSGIIKYKYLASTEKLNNPELTEENSIEVEKTEDIVIKDIYKIKYIYIVAEDKVGNISNVYEFEVPQLILTSQVNLNTENGKGEVILDWSSYDVNNKYFVIYRKQENTTDWKKIIDLGEKYTLNKYTDILANDKNKPTKPSININSDEQNNNVIITTNSTDTGSKYIYYIESYDSYNTQELINISNQVNTN